MTSAELSIREAQESDLPAVFALYADPDVDDGYVLPQEQALQIFRRMRAYPFLKVYVAELDGQVVGTYELLIMDNLAHAGAPSAVVEDVVVAGGLRGRGIGRALMAHALDVCRSQGCYKVSLSSAQFREAAHRFYDRLGFERYGVAFVVGPWDPRHVN